MTTNTKSDGGPAFPQHVAPQYTARPYLHGMSLRDYFAGQAISGIIASPDYYSGSWACGQLAEQAYGIADAMIAERAR